MSSPVRRELEDFLAGRTTPEQVVSAVALAFYRDTQGVRRETLRPLINVIDRASPGVVQLGSMRGGSGFEVRLAERPFPREHEAALRRAAEEVLQRADATPAVEEAPDSERVGWVHIALPSEGRTSGPSEGPAEEHSRRPMGWMDRIVSAVRRLFSR